VASSEAARLVGSLAPMFRRQMAAACRYLSPHQAAVLDAVTRHLLPGTPVVAYVDGLLARCDAKPCARRIRVADLRDEYTNGIALLDHLAGGDFTAVPPQRQGLIVSHAQVSPLVSLLFESIVEAIETG
jgi:hypothetical protein